MSSAAFTWDSLSGLACKLLFKQSRLLGEVQYRDSPAMITVLLCTAAAHFSETISGGRGLIKDTAQTIQCISLVWPPDSSVVQYVLRYAYAMGFARLGSLLFSLGEAQQTRELPTRGPPKRLGATPTRQERVTYRTPHLKEPQKKEVMPPTAARIYCCTSYSSFCNVSVCLLCQLQPRVRSPLSSVGETHTLEPRTPPMNLPRDSVATSGPRGARRRMDPTKGSLGKAFLY